MPTPLEMLTRAAARHHSAESRWLAARDRYILAARDAGATWPEIAEAAGMSRAGVINAYGVAKARAEADKPRRARLDAVRAKHQAKPGDNWQTSQ